MQQSLERSIDRAVARLRTPPDHVHYLSLKLEPLTGDCCCFHCWPDTWRAINEEFGGDTPMKDEGDLLVSFPDAPRSIVLECHESGPEIIVYIGVLAASLALADRIVSLVLTLLKARQRDRGRPTPELRMTARRVRDDGLVHEERSLDIHLPLTAGMAEEIADYVADAIANADLPSDATGDAEAPL
jgi:hypothetical protein